MSSYIFNCMGHVVEVIYSAHLSVRKVTRAVRIKSTQDLK